MYRNLMVRYQAGDGTAFEALYEALAPCIRQYCTQGADSLDEAADRMNQVFLAIHFARRTYSPRARFEPWLAAVVRHAAATAPTPATVPAPAMCPTSALNA